MPRRYMIRRDKRRRIRARPIDSQILRRQDMMGVPKDIIRSETRNRTHTRAPHRIRTSTEDIKPAMIFTNITLGSIPKMPRITGKRRASIGIKRIRNPPKIIIIMPSRGPAGRKGTRRMNMATPKKRKNGEEGTPGKRRNTTKNIWTATCSAASIIIGRQKVHQILTTRIILMLIQCLTSSNSAENRHLRRKIKHMRNMSQAKTQIFIKARGATTRGLICSRPGICRIFGREYIIRLL